MTPAWHARARALSEEGLSVRQVAARLGRSRGGVQFALEPEKDDKRPCPHCAGVRSRDRLMCEGCRRAVYAVRRSLVEGMWADGWTYREIAVALGWSATASLPVAQLRASGWDLPRRNRVRAVR